MKTRSGFFGNYPMVYALFDANGNLSRSAMRKQVASLLAHKVHGVAVLGLATEVNKLSLAERHTVMEWVAEDIGGRVPLAVTVAEVTAAGQSDFVKAAAGLGAKWVILQPPPVKGVPEIELIRFFGAVAEKSSLPLGIQNAPEYLGIGLSHGGIKALNKAHPNLSIVKLEATALSIAELMQEVDGAMDVFNGRAGVEMVDSMRAGAVGFIPGAETFDVTTRIFDLMASGKPDSMAEAERLYQSVLPLLVFLMESMGTFLIYGKQVLGHRLGIAETAPRAPSGAATRFGLETARRYAEMLGKL
ncbi:dihydrodipicolinate synthase family protein [Hypericibacter terrae]|jgi:4-hydroxy-tetrahydrodipicolinate synthase|uniref:Dihydrodipicolinate synthase family protein n=1 Tax=Hypericibacter terrae TaxID=2602015 RepID=A0A5J6MQ19_9PROT|nr:dihydrodipicolinate synthase family protein [Hypericibacter terrae]QEX18755.1 dihydrodipicolinate synthase family protein [Hypericibacter terrae]